MCSLIRSLREYQAVFNFETQKCTKHSTSVHSTSKYKELNEGNLEIKLYTNSFDLRGIN